MAKGIQKIIEDRIEDGVDAWRTLLRLAKTDEHPEVKIAAQFAGVKLMGATKALRALETKIKKCLKDDAALGTIDDPRQARLPDTEAPLCESCTKGIGDEPWMACGFATALEAGEPCSDYRPRGGE